MKRYTATTADGDQLTGSSYEIASWLQEQDWDFGQAGAEGQFPWRRAVAGRVTIQTGRTLDAGVVEAQDPESFLWALSAAGILSLDTAEESTVGEGESTAGESEAENAGH